ncbi:MAG: hypothetical protein KBG15_12755, partial [Kofleriaceae bacterium]|nr:hypothetical protein [Kofleriaceae bacterium]
ITPPHGTNKRIFVSTATFVPNMAGRQQADDICAAEAAGVGLPRTFLAFLGTSTSSPISRFEPLESYQRVDGQPLGPLAAPPLSFINRSADSTIVNGDVWAENPSTVPTQNCEDWTITVTSFGGHGRSNVAGSGAYVDASLPYSNCSSTFRVYCVEK